MPFDSITSISDPGIPLRLTSNLNVKSVRATVKQCYDQVIADLLLAEDMLPATVPLPVRPCRAAADAMLARVYLALGDYTGALTYADKALESEQYTGRL